jgi:cephalosporin-C deacetylase-like acetyl esterase
MIVSRRELLALSPLALGARAAAVEDGSLLWDYFVRELTEADDRRRHRLELLRSPDDLSALRSRVRQTLLASFGAFPERTPLNARQVGALERSDYTVEKIIFESRPRFYVTANLYLPHTISGRRPAIIQSCGHHWAGKAAPDYQRASIGLARKGFVVLTFDPLGQGERIMYPESRELKPESRPTTEHDIAGKPCFLLGITLANYRIWDAMRALDYLESRPEVDKAHLGMVGHSGGGMTTLLTAPLEDRLQAIMSCCAVTSFYHKFRAFLPGDPEQNVPNIYCEGIDHPELIATVAPRAFLIGATLEDFVPLEGARRTYAETRRLFEIAGVPDRFALSETPGPHALNHDMREACYGWMLKHLAGETGDAREPEITIETEPDLRCAGALGTLGMANAQTVFDLNRSASKRLASSRRGAPDLRALLNMRAAPAAPKQLDGQGTGFRIASEAGIVLPATLSGQHPHDNLLVLVAEQGRNARGTQTLTQHFVNAGCSVLALDLRGWGDSRPATDGRAGRSLNEDFFAVHAIELGRPLLGMRVHDLLAAVQLMRADYKKIFAVGLEGGGLVAMHAALLDPSIDGVASFQTLISYQDVMEHPRYAEPLASFVPGALAHYDLADLTTGIRPRPCVAVEPRDSARRPFAAPLRDEEAARAILNGLFRSA